MRQTTTRRAPDGTIVSTSGKSAPARLGAGDHLDLGMTVSVYRAGPESPLAASEDETAPAPVDAARLTEH